MTKPLSEFLGQATKHRWCKPCYYAWRRDYLKTPKGKINIARKNQKPYMKFSRLKQFAKQRGIPVLITKDDYLQLIQNDCAYCCFPIEPYASGLDRMDNALGYQLGNLVPCCGICNRVKSSVFSFSEMKRLGKVVAEIRSSWGARSL